MENKIYAKSIPIILNKLKKNKGTKYLLNLEIIGPIILCILDDEIISFSFNGIFVFPRKKDLHFSQIFGIIFQYFSNDYQCTLREEDVSVDLKNTESPFNYFKSFFTKDKNLYLNYKRDLFWNTGNFNNVNLQNDIRFVKNYILENKSILFFHKIKNNIKFIEKDNLEFLLENSATIEIDLYYSESPLCLGRKIEVSYFRRTQLMKIKQKVFSLEKLRNVFYDFLFAEKEYFENLVSYEKKYAHLFRMKENADEGSINKNNIFIFVRRLIKISEVFRKLIFSNLNILEFKNLLLQFNEEDMKLFIREFISAFNGIYDQLVEIYEILITSYFFIEYEVDLRSGLILIYHRFIRIKIFLEDILKYYKYNFGIEMFYKLNDEQIAILKKAEENRIMYFSDNIRDHFNLSRNVIYCDQMWCTHHDSSLMIVLFTEYIFIFHDKQNVEFKNSTLSNFRIIDSNKLKYTEMREEEDILIIEIFSQKINSNIYINKQISFENVTYRRYKFKKTKKYSIVEKFYYFKGLRKELNIFNQYRMKNILFHQYEYKSFNERYIRPNSIILLVDCSLSYFEDFIGKNMKEDVIVERSILLIYLNRKNKTLRYFSSKGDLLKSDTYLEEEEIYDLLMNKIQIHKFTFPLLQFDYIKYMNSMFIFNRSNQLTKLSFKPEYKFGLGYFLNIRKLMAFIEDVIVDYKVVDLYSNDISIRRYNEIIEYMYEQRKNYAAYSLYDLTAVVNIFFSKTFFELYNANYAKNNSYIIHFIKHFIKILTINPSIKLIHLVKLFDENMKEENILLFLENFINLQ